MKYGFNASDPNGFRRPGSEYDAQGRRKNLPGEPLKSPKKPRFMSPEEKRAFEAARMRRYRARVRAAEQNERTGYRVYAFWVEFSDGRAFIRMDTSISVDPPNRKYRIFDQAERLSHDLAPRFVVQIADVPAGSKREAEGLISWIVQRNELQFYYKGGSFKKGWFIPTSNNEELDAKMKSDLTNARKLSEGRWTFPGDPEETKLPPIVYDDPSDPYGPISGYPPLPGDPE